MGELTKHISVSTPIETVFNYVSDPHNAPKYVSSIKKIMSGPEGVASVGQRWQAEADFLGKHTSITLRLAALIPPKMVRFALEGEPQAMLSLQLRPGDKPGATNVSLTLEVPSVPTLLITMLMNNLLTADMERLKRVFG